MNDRDQLFLKNTCLLLGLQGDVTIVEKHGFRWVLEYIQSPNHPDFAKSMIKLETLLQKETGRPIDLRLESKEDKNKRQKRNVLWQQQT